MLFAASEGFDTFYGLARRTGRIDPNLALTNYPSQALSVAKIGVVLGTFCFLRLRKINNSERLLKVY